jgi:hypothetical protein
LSNLEQQTSTEKNWWDKIGSNYLKQRAEDRIPLSSDLGHKFADGLNMKPVELAGRL